MGKQAGVCDNEYIKYRPALFPLCKENSFVRSFMMIEQNFPMIHSSSLIKIRKIRPSKLL